MEVLIFGSLGFWISLVIVSIIMTILMETVSDDSVSPWGWNIVFLIYLGFIYFLGNSQWFKNSYEFILNNPLKTSLYIIGYIISGFIWSLIRWYIFLDSIRKKLERDRSEMDIWTKQRFNPANNRGRIIGWMMYWPISLIWNIIHHPIRGVFSFAFEKFRGLFDYISNQILKNFEKNQSR